MREIARQTASAPAYVGVVFTSALGFRRASAGPESESGGWDRLGTTVYNVSSTPQVLIDNQISEEDGQLLCNWDVAEDMFAPGVVDAMFAAYASLLKALADGTGWDEGAVSAPALPRAPLLPAAAPELLHAAFEAQARRTPERVALIAPDAELSYGLLDRAAGHLAAGVAARLGDQRRDRLVAIVLPKGWRQIVAVLAVLKTGAAYLPIDPALPDERRRLLIERSEAIVLDDSAAVDAALAAAQAGAAPPALAPVTDPSRLSYVIYTSGSTGEPKGVMIEHRGRGDDGGRDQPALVGRARRPGVRPVVAELRSLGLRHLRPAGRRRRAGAAGCRGEPRSVAMVRAAAPARRDDLEQRAGADGDAGRVRPAGAATGCGW